MSKEKWTIYDAISLLTEWVKEVSERLNAIEEQHHQEEYYKDLSSRGTVKLGELLAEGMKIGIDYGGEDVTPCANPMCGMDKADRCYSDSKNKYDCYTPEYPINKPLQFYEDTLMDGERDQAQKVKAMGALGATTKSKFLAVYHICKRSWDIVEDNDGKVKSVSGIDTQLYLVLEELFEKLSNGWELKEKEKKNENTVALTVDCPIGKDGLPIRCADCDNTSCAINDRVYKEQANEKEYEKHGCQIACKDCEGQEECWT